MFLLSTLVSQVNYHSANCSIFINRPTICPIHIVLILTASRNKQLQIKLNSHFCVPRCGTVEFDILRILLCPSLGMRVWYMKRGQWSRRGRRKTGTNNKDLMTDNFLLYGLLFYPDLHINRKFLHFITPFLMTWAGLFLPSPSHGSV
jgi:hypothetical protein